MEEVATFGAGCFWGVETAFRIQKGVIDTVAGYTGGLPQTKFTSSKVEKSRGTTYHPTYENVCTGQTGHVEALEITFDPEIVSYQRLLDIFWQIHDPTLTNRQGLDVGTQYQAAIFYHNDDQKEAAEKSKEQLAASGQFAQPIATLIRSAVKFWPAEEEHQHYLEKHPGGYCHINLNAIH